MVRKDRLFRQPRGAGTGGDRTERQVVVCHFEGFERYHENDQKPLKDFKFQGDTYVSKLGFRGTYFTKDLEEGQYLIPFSPHQCPPHSWYDQ